MRAFLLLSLLFVGCRAGLPESKTCPNWTAANLIAAAQGASYAALNATTPEIQGTQAKKGLLWSDRCVTAFPNEAGCYYYRALNTGLYYEIAPIRYQKGLKSMVADLNTVLAKDPTYDHGGAYRVLGNIYLKVPSFSLVKKGIVKDLSLAEDMAGKALATDPADAGNRLLMAEVLMEKEEYEKALNFLSPLKPTLEAQPDTKEKKENLETVTKLIDKARRKLKKN